MSAVCVSGAQVISVGRGGGAPVPRLSASTGPSSRQGRGWCLPAHGGIGPALAASSGPSRKRDRLPACPSLCPPFGAKPVTSPLTFPELELFSGSSGCTLCPCRPEGLCGSQGGSSRPGWLSCSNGGLEPLVCAQPGWGEPAGQVGSSEPLLPWYGAGLADGLPLDRGKQPPQWAGPSCRGQLGLDLSTVRPAPRLTS